jgi:putative transposase
VRKSPLPVKQTLEALGVLRSAYYRWLKHKRLQGPDGLQDRRPRPGRVWDGLREQEVDTVLEYARRETDTTSRELAYRITDHAGFSVSESTVHRILRRRDLIFPAQVEVAQAAKESRRKSTRVHELWQTDLTYSFVHGWGWYYVGGVLDDYSRYLITYQVIKDMTGETLCDLVQQAVAATDIEDVPVAHKPTLLSDNGSGYLSRPLNEYLELKQIRHLFTARLHPQTIGKFVRLSLCAQSHASTARPRTDWDW